MAFNGKLIELKNGNNWVEFPLKYVQFESYKVTPNQRMESSANRAATGLLVRTTVAHTASKIDLTTPPITNREANAINSMLSTAYIDVQQRKLLLRYYDPSSDSYKTGEFYVPDIDFEIQRVDLHTNTIHYNPIRIAFIEY